MAADLPLYLLLAVLAIPFILSFFATRRAAHHGPGDGAGRLPPGPWALPVIGHLHHLAGALPHRALRDLARRHGPLMALRLGELPVAVASSPDAAREVMRTHDAAFAVKQIHVQDMFGAGSETSATTLQWAMAELMRNPKGLSTAYASILGACDTRIPTLRISNQWF